MTQSANEVGSTANSYVILAKLATGGMAELFLARNASGAGIERYVVLKRVLSQRMHDREFVGMFLDEARLAAQLQHPNIAQVYDTGVLGDAYFFTMEYVHGETVREIMTTCARRAQRAPIGCALAIAVGAAAGLHHAHERNGMDGRPLGIVHRDVSPSNLMVSYEGNVKVVDFGVAKATVRSTQTHSGTVKGKIAYLSPEQCRGQAIDRRSDLFSLGIVLWEMLAGRRMFVKQTDYETMESIVKEPAPPLAALRPEIPAAIDAIVQRMLAKSPAERFQTGGAVVEAIEHAAVDAGIPLSSASVARCMRDLFGTRPEPWVEMRAHDAKAEAVTVTASPALGSVNNVTSQQLAAIPELARPSSQWPVTPPSGVTVPPSGPSTVPYPRTADDDDENRPTTTSRAKARARPLDEPRARRRSGVILATIGACGVAAAVGIGATRTMLSSRATRDAAPAPAVVDPARSATPPAPPHETTALAGAPADAAPSPADAALVVADAARVVAAHAGSARPPAEHVAHPVHHEPPPSPAELLARAIRGEHNAETVALCAANPRLAADNIVSCMLAACRVHQVARAKRWLELAGASRHDELVRACRAAGTEVEPKPRPPPQPAGPDCDADPMACRH